MGPVLRLKIGHKLFITLLLVLALVLALTAVLSQRSFTQGFYDYLEAVEQQRITRLEDALIEGYSAEGSWAFLRQNPRVWYRLMVQADLAPPPPKRRFNDDAQRPSSRHRSEPASPIPAGRVVLLDAHKQHVVGRYAQEARDRIYPITFENQVIGYLAVERFKKLHHLLDRQFAAQQVQAFYLIALLALLLAVVAAWLLARQLSRPITQLTHSARKLTAGEYQTRIEQKGHDELAELACDFNQLAKTLEKNRSARNQWVADISHELRTPLTVLQGELDALEDGVRPLNRAALSSLVLEVGQLQRLVQDLYELSLSDLGALTYRKEPLSPVELLDEQISQFRGRFDEQALCLDVDLAPCADIQVMADPQRLAQLFGNLLENSLRYTDPGGRVRISARADGALWLVFEDSAPGLNAEQRAKMFERLYRADRSRSRAHGGSGLGLSIVSSIVAGHGGTIRSDASALGGIKIEIQLPRRAAGWGSAS